MREPISITTPLISGTSDQSVNQPDSQRVRRSITRFRRLTLVSVAMIMAINFIMVQRMTSVLEYEAAAKINESARMRLLSQRVRSAAFEIDTAVRNTRWERLEPLHTDLVSTTSELETIHQSIFAGGSTQVVFKGAKTDELDQIASINTPFQRMITASKELQLLTRNTIRRAPYIDPLTRDRISTTMEEIREAQDYFLPRMQTIVELFEQRSRSEINQSTTQAHAGILVLAIMLCAMVLFIIEPTILIIRKQLQELDRATTQARRADSVRWRLLTNMGHEFRTPMNAVLGFTDLLTEDALTETERSRLANSIHDSAQHLASLIETMLDMSAIESGQLRINPANCTLAKTLAPVLDRARTVALAKGLELHIKLDDSCNATITADARRLAQIVDKLIDNAVKFTEKGNIALNATVEQNPKGDRIVIQIRDTGIGIDDSEKQHIFEAFHQSQNTLTREFGGSGLGLSFAQDLARAMDGDISVVSTPDKGSVFTLSISARNQAATIAAPSNSSIPLRNDALANKRILIVDDAKDNRVLLQHYFKSTRAHIDFAYDGQQAVERITKARDNDAPFHIVLMDMQMPVLDGYSATRQLRQLGITTPIIALTAHALDGDRDQCIDAGCDEYITKPVNRKALINACIQMIESAAHTHQRTAA